MTRAYQTLKSTNARIDEVVTRLEFEAFEQDRRIEMALASIKALRDAAEVEARWNRHANYVKWGMALAVFGLILLKSF